VQTPALLHTTVARLLSPARRPPRRAAAGPGAGAEVPPARLAAELGRAAEALTRQLCGLAATFDELW
jgi:hypothetical protein